MLLSTGTIVAILSLLFLFVVVGFVARLVDRTEQAHKRVDEALDAVEATTLAPARDIASLALPSCLPIGASAPPFETAPGNNGKPSFLVFVSDDCGPCEGLVPEIETWRQQSGERLNIIVKSDNDLRDRYRVNWAPAAVVVGSNGKIASETAFGDTEIRALFEHYGRDARPWRRLSDGSDRPEVGSAIPALRLKTTTGTVFELSSLAGRESLLLFWNPFCEFCNGMINELIAWRQRDPPQMPRLVIISSAPDPEIEHIPGTIVLYSDDDVANNAFAVRGTPSAVLINEHGRIASSLATGVDDFLALIA